MKWVFAWLAVFCLVIGMRACEMRQAGLVTPVERVPLTAEKVDALKQARQPLQAKLDGSRLPVARFKLEAMDEDVLWASKVGGAPYLPVGASIPLDPDGDPMVLLAQVNLAEVQLENFPRRGMLQFFIAGKEVQGAGYGVKLPDAPPYEEKLAEQFAFRVVYWETVVREEDRLQRVDPRDTEGSTPHEPTNPRRMVFSVGLEEISALDVHFKDVVGVNPHEWVEREALRLGIDAFDASEVAFNSGSGHKLGGYPMFSQYDMREPGSRRRLLLQLATDDTIMWGDAGIGNFFIDPDDLARADFSRVMYTWDCY
jgi:uncharacterized protein YwqG